METKKKYQSPQLTVATFRTECGYAVSGIGLAIFESSREQGTTNLEDRQMLSDDKHWGNDWND